MKISASREPNPFTVVRMQTEALLTLCDNIQSREIIDLDTGRPMPLWDCDQYTMTVKYRANLKADIAENFEGWIQKAKEQEEFEAAQRVRAYRDDLLNLCDTTYCNAANWSLMDSAAQAQWQEYKQALRDIPEQEGFPHIINWPTMPEILKYKWR